MRTAGHAEQRARGAWRAWLGWGIAAAAVAWLLHDADPRDIMQRLVRLDVRWLAPAVALDITGYLAQGIRWSLVMRPVARISPWRASVAIYAGLFANEVAPARLGELVRVSVARRWSGAAWGALVSTVAVERVMDGVWTLAGLAVCAAWMPLPAAVARGGDILAAVLAAVLVIGLGLVVARRQRNAWAARALSIVRAPALAIAFVVSLAIPLLEGLALWCVLQAYGMPLGVLAGLAVSWVLRLATALPAAPGNIGSYQVALVLALAMFGVGKPQATSFAIAAWTVLTVPLWILGGLAFARSGMRWHDISAASSASA